MRYGSAYWCMLSIRCFSMWWNAIRCRVIICVCKAVITAHSPLFFIRFCPSWYSAFCTPVIMKWRKRCSVKWFGFWSAAKVCCCWLWSLAMLARDGFVLSRDIGSVLTGTVFASLPLLGMALAQTFAVAIVSLQINRKKRWFFIFKTGCPRFRRPFVDETSY